jgi:hypothetical protein
MLALKESFKPNKSRKNLANQTSLLHTLPLISEASWFHVLGSGNWELSKRMMLHAAQAIDRSMFVGKARFQSAKPVCREPRDLTPAGSSPQFLLFE